MKSRRVELSCNGNQHEAQAEGKRWRRGPWPQLLGGWMPMMARFLALLSSTRDAGAEIGDKNTRLMPRETEAPQPAAVALATG